ncbi:MAG: hypothetical protein ABIQ82_05815 [Variovorax sp.]
MTASEPTRSPETTTPLDEALSQTQDVQARLNSGAQELFVIKEVLKHELPANARTGDVAQALEKHDALEEAVQECADDLEDVSQALAQEVARRENLEEKLTETRADLAGIAAQMAAQHKSSGN